MKARILVAVLFTLPLMAADWSQWRGPNRDGVSKETGLLKEWPKGGPKLLWTFKKAGAGYSCPAIVGDRLYTMGARDADEYLICLDIKDPAAVRELWAVKFAPIFVENVYQAGDGPRATPTVDNGLVYGLSGDGNLVCVQADSGALKWRVSMLKDLDGQVDPVGGGLGKNEGEPLLGWGYSWSPLVDGDKLICTPGGPKGAVAALDKRTGKVLWRSKDFTEQCSYASPVLAEVGGIRHYVVLTDNGVTGISTSGATLWHYPKKPSYNEVLMATPIVHEEFVFVTGLKNAGCDLIKLAANDGKLTATRVYANKNMTTGQGGVVLVGGHAYGYSVGKGWVCQDFKSGKVLWNEKYDLESGSLMAADGHLYLLGEDYGAKEGSVILVEASTQEWRPRGRFALPEETSLRNKPTHKNGRRWTPPVIANGKLFLRDQELIFCYAVK
jgi:outer membrane protein assembly factor BamB